MNEIANNEPGQASFDTWANIAYLLYQGPQKKRGSDAVLRSFLVASGTHLLGQPPILPQDIDLRAYAVGQDKFVDYLKAHSESHRP